MIYRLRILFLIFALSGFIAACKTSKSLSNASTDSNIKLEDALLWKITGDGIKQPSYLFGTIHLIPAKDYFLPQGTLSAIDQSKKMMFELDMAEMSDMSNIMGLMDKLFMKDEVTLKDLISEKDYSMVEEKFKDLGLPMFFVEKMKPMILTAFASGDMSPTAIQDGSMKSYEMEFYEMAENKNLLTGGLETVEVQLAIFDSIPYKEQAKMLVEGLKIQNTEDDEYKKMIDMYKGQKINEMVAMIQSEESGLADHEDIFLKKRNESWIQPIITNAKSQVTFFAVGAGHLAGNHGVIQLLRNKGIKVEAVK